MNLSGANFIGGMPSADGTDIISAYNPVTGDQYSDKFHVATSSEVDRAVTLANEAFHVYRSLTNEARASFLEAIATEIEALGDALLDQAAAETALAQPRLAGERGRTTGQLRSFAVLIRDGSWVQARINTALPDRKPLPRPDLRRMLIPLGPVAVFGASNFPFAYSVAGGDTASALAAGCPVIIKAHPAHPGVSELTAKAVLAAAKSTGMPDGVFSMVHGGKEVGLELVRHPLLQAAGFTGSLIAGRALFDAAAARENPIPVYAEMGSVNPVFVLPGALAQRGDSIASGLAGSITLGVGQFCTNPGLIISTSGSELDTLRANVGAVISQTAPGTMLHPGIGKAYSAGLSRLSHSGGVSVAGKAGPGVANQASAALFVTDGKTFLSNRELAEENFGPSSLLIACSSRQELEEVASAMEGQLTASIHGTEADFKEYANLISILELRVGRLVFNGYPTGVEVCPAMVHGGPYPATTDSRTTSVGTAAIERFVRPICFQDAPESVLPVELRNENPNGIWRLVEGELTQAPISAT